MQIKIKNKDDIYSVNGLTVFPLFSQMSCTLKKVTFCTSLTQ